jgi:hypothetical protein
VCGGGDVLNYVFISLPMAEDIIHDVESRVSNVLKERFHKKGCIMTEEELQSAPKADPPSLVYCRQAAIEIIFFDNGSLEKQFMERIFNRLIYAMDVTMQTLDQWNNNNRYSHETTRPDKRMGRFLVHLNTGLVDGVLRICVKFVIKPDSTVFSLPYNL